MAINATHKNRRAVSAIPAYQRIEEDIREKVRDGRLLAGTMLANRHNLAREYGVALSTVQQAIANLIADGTLETYDRRGTFVSRERRYEAESAVIDASLLQNSRGSRGSAAPGRYSSTVLPIERAAVTLGIMSTARIATEDPLDIGSVWARQAIRSLEHCFAAADGTTHFFDRYPEHRGPYTRGFDDENAVPMAEAIGALRAQGADALAIIGLCDSRDMSDEVVAAVDIEEFPTVYISWHEIRPPLAQVFYDNRFAGYQAAQHLLRKGYRRLLCLAPFTETWLTERIDGARDAVRHAGLASQSLQIYPLEPPNILYYDEHVAEATYRLMQQAYAEGKILSGSAGELPPGILAPNDHTAYSILQAAMEQGKIVGRDYGLIGFDDHPRSCTVGLTTVRPPVEAMGE